MSGSSSKPVSDRVSTARANCVRSLHSWRPTWTAGEFLCRWCGAYAYCPLCVPANPGMRLHYCFKHRPKDDEEP